LGFGVVGIFVADLTVLGGDQVVSVLLREDLLVGNWLDCGVVVILMHLTVYSLNNLLMSMGLDGLLDHCRSDMLVDCGGVALLGGEVVDSIFGGLHDCGFWCGD